MAVARRLPLLNRSERRSARRSSSPCRGSEQPTARISGSRALPGKRPSGRRGRDDADGNPARRGGPRPGLHPVRRHPPFPGDLAVPVGEHAGTSELGRASRIQDAHPRRARQGDPELRRHVPVTVEHEPAAPGDPPSRSSPRGSSSAQGRPMSVASFSARSSTGSGSTWWCSITTGTAPRGASSSASSTSATSWAESAPCPSTSDRLWGAVESSADHVKARQRAHRHAAGAHDAAARRRRPCGRDFQERRAGVANRAAERRSARSGSAPRRGRGA